MKNKIVSLLVAVLFLGLGSFAFAQGGGKRIQKLTVGATIISQGTVKVGENLTTKEGQTLSPGTYRVAVAVNSLQEAQFELSPFKVENITLKTGLEANAMNKNQQEKAPIIISTAQVVKNSLVKGLASNIEGTFRMEAMTPTEAMLTFDSNQFSANAIMGRSLDSKLIDLRPSFVTIENQTECGANCMEGNVKVTVRNDGNSVARGKWNIILLDPQLFVGSVADVPAFGEVSMISEAKVKLPCCAAQSITIEVHADFYNKDAVDANDANNTKGFTLRFK